MSQKILSKIKEFYSIIECATYSNVCDVTKRAFREKLIAMKMNIYKKINKFTIQLNFLKNNNKTKQRLKK